MNDAVFAPIAIAAGGLCAVLLRHGARFAEFRGPSGRPLVLGYGDPRDHLRHAELYCGAVIGRFANRVARGRAEVDGAPVALEVNAPPHH